MGDVVDQPGYGSGGDLWCLYLREVAHFGYHHDLGSQLVADPLGFCGRVLPVDVRRPHDDHGWGLDLTQPLLGRRV